MITMQEGAMRLIPAFVAVCLCSAAAPAAAAAAPDLSGIWLRTGDLWFDALSDDDPAKPVQRLTAKGRDAGDI